MKNSEEKPQIVFPDGLTQKDIELILAQCKNQEATSKGQIEGFALAYKKARELAGDSEKLKSLKPGGILNLIQEFAELAEIRNRSGYRKVPVRFKDMSRAIDPAVIDRAIDGFAGTYAAGELEPEELYKEFEKIHPYVDGNGRVGDLLWKIATARKTGKWPEELPPDLFKK